MTLTPALDVNITSALDCDADNVRQVCQAATAKGTTGGCTLALTVVPTINYELLVNIDKYFLTYTDTTFVKNPVYLPAKQQEYTAHGYPVCLVGSWSQDAQERRSLLSTLSGIENGIENSWSIKDATTAAPIAGAAAVFTTSSTAIPTSTHRSLADVGIRNDLQNQGKNTPCQKDWNDCNGHGFCVDTTDSGYRCMCHTGWRYCFVGCILLPQLGI